LSSKSQHDIINKVNSIDDIDDSISKILNEPFSNTVFPASPYIKKFRIAEHKVIKSLYKINENLEQLYVHKNKYLSIKK